MNDNSCTEVIDVVSEATAQVSMDDSLIGVVEIEG